MKANEPHDCEWLKAPIGDKLCHYEIRVHTFRTAWDTYGKTIFSDNEGLTWLPYDGIARPYYEVPVQPVVSSVSLTWEKIDSQ
jgi:hypothetical protein